MTPAAFRKLVLSLPETEERQHISHPDFRVAGKIFATLGYPDKTRGMVKLSPEDQHNFSKDYPDTFIPVKGTWGRRDATSVVLKAAKEDALAKALQAAWRNTAPKALSRGRLPFQGKASRVDGSSHSGAFELRYPRTEGGGWSVPIARLSYPTIPRFVQNAAPQSTPCPFLLPSP